MRQKIGEFFKDVYQPLVVISETRARTDFNAARDDAIILLQIHDQASGGKAGRPKRELEALKRSSLILTVTAWESFVEDTVVVQLETLLGRTTDPTEMSSIFNGIAHDWLKETSNGLRKPTELIDWAGDKWKNIIKTSLIKHLDYFNTPNSKNVAGLFKRYLGIDITKSWSWQAVSSAKARQQLDDLIRLRGSVVHRGKTIHPLSAQTKDVRRDLVVDALNLVYNLVDVTERELGVAPLEKV